MTYSDVLSAAIANDVIGRIAGNGAAKSPFWSGKKKKKMFGALIHHCKYNVRFMCWFVQLEFNVYFAFSRMCNPFSASIEQQQRVPQTQN